MEHGIDYLPLIISLWFTVLSDIKPLRRSGRKLNSAYFCWSWFCLNLWFSCAGRQEFRPCYLNYSLLLLGERSVGVVSFMAVYAAANPFTVTRRSIEFPSWTGDGLNSCCISKLIDPRFGLRYLVGWWYGMWRTLGIMWQTLFGSCCKRIFGMDTRWSQAWRWRPALRTSANELWELIFRIFFLWNFSGFLPCTYVSQIHRKILVWLVEAFESYSDRTFRGR